MWPRGECKGWRIGDWGLNLRDTMSEWGIGRFAVVDVDQLVCYNPWCRICFFFIYFLFCLLPAVVFCGPNGGWRHLRSWSLVLTHLCPHVDADPRCFGDPPASYHLESHGQSQIGFFIMRTIKKQMFNHQMAAVLSCEQFVPAVPLVYCLFLEYVLCGVWGVFVSFVWSRLLRHLFCFSVAGQDPLCSVLFFWFILDCVDQEF